MQFTLRQRVRTTVDTLAARGTPSIPAGSPGTISGLPTKTVDTYGVILDSDPDQLPASYTSDELTPA